MPSAAFFDMDRTVLTVNSAALWVRYLHRRGEISRWLMVRALGWSVQYRFALLDLEALSKMLIKELAGDPESMLLETCDRCYSEELEPTIAAEARRAITEHRARGEKVVLLTSAIPYLAEPLARTLALDDVLCSRLEVRAGRFTGRIVEPLCFGHGKVLWAEKWAHARSIDLAASSFYTDSYHDLPMLERVGMPVVVNPDIRLSRVARLRGWPIRKWDGSHQ